MSNFIIGIAGDSGAGKTSFLKFLKNLWKDDLLLIEGDAYHKWERNDPHWNKMTPLNPDANSLDQSFEDLKKLKNNEEIRFREYNHNNGKFDNEKILKPRKKIIFAGLHSLYTQKLRDIEDLKIYLNTDEDLRLFWKYKRDIGERGYKKEDVDKAISERIKDSKKYIRPQIYYADIIIDIIDEDLDINNFSYVPKVLMTLYIKKDLKVIKEILHLLKNINFKMTEDEKFVKAVYEERFEQIQSLSL